VLNKTGLGPRAGVDDDSGDISRKAASLERSDAGISRHKYPRDGSHEADITAKRHEAGSASDYDVAQAQALVAQVRSATPELEGQRRANAAMQHTLR
jgi:hypothetical protein